MAQGQDQLPPCLAQATASVTPVMSPRDGGDKQALLPSSKGVLRTGARRQPCLQEPDRRSPRLQSVLWAPLM